MFALLLALTVASAACRGGKTAATDTSQPSRPFMMGISTLPRELNGDSYAAAFRLAGQSGDMVLIQRTPPWGDFLPGADVGQETASTTASERKAIAGAGVKLFFAIDPTDAASGRDRLANLPPALAGKGFGDPDVRTAFVSYARYVALNYRPAYLALGVEMNLYYQRNKDDFTQFESLYQEAYDRVKEISPQTQVTVTFQYEDLQSLLPTTEPHLTDWQLVRRFDDKVDVTAISTYPGFAFRSVADVPKEYYSQLSAFTDRPIVIAQTGYSSAAGTQGLNNGTEAEQDAFLKRVLEDAQALKMPFVIWFAAWDPAYARDTPSSAFQSIGLRRSDDTPKPAWDTWIAAKARPLRP
ncbi:MAG: hypothetical protein HYX50_04160 [Chloroflexi bacterium]|nr:hypothetical protein [Chloroflexota bacterium]